MAGQFEDHIKQELDALDNSTRCAYQDCGHRLDDHSLMETTTFGDAGVEKVRAPCVKIDMATRGVCACRNFEIPVTKNPEAPQIVPTSDDPPVVTSSIIAGVRLNFHEGGSVSWERIPGVEVP